MDPFRSVAHREIRFNTDFHLIFLNVSSKVTVDMTYAHSADNATDLILLSAIEMYNVPSNVSLSALTSPSRLSSIWAKVVLDDIESWST
nr:unnamed protein product [Spirometra erinaceieuropaei]